MDTETRNTAEDFLDLIAPLGARMKAMFGGYCVYVQNKVIALVCDGHVFIKRSDADALFEEWATLCPAYPGARETWRLPEDSVLNEPQRVFDAVRQVGDALPSRK